jgi:hypothetical protein
MPRNLPGIRSEDWNYPVHTTNYQLHIQHAISLDPHAIDKILEIPLGFETSQWKYHQIRQICLQLNDLFSFLQEDCSLETCPEMKTGEWLFLCAAHQEPSACAAIDYILHAIDGSAVLLNSEMFANREKKLSLQAEKLCQNVVRRLYRIFAHAWFHHHEIYLDFEQRTGLYQRFLQLCTVKYDLIKPEMVTIPGKTVIDP